MEVLRVRSDSYASCKPKKYKRNNIIPYESNTQDLMMKAPSEVDNKQLKDLSIKIDFKKS